MAMNWLVATAHLRSRRHADEDMSENGSTERREDGRRESGEKRGKGRGESKEERGEERRDDKRVVVFMPSIHTQKKSEATVEIHQHVFPILFET